MNYTKKILRQSNYWYNDGLRKAQIRDMSGAILSLRKSLQYNRANIDARNLLGLVYYGRGEVAEGLVEWIISKNLKPKDNIANYFIDEVQKSANQLEVINQAVKKYNQCLNYCNQQGEDLAIIQLQKVISRHPTFLKAYQLLALLYLHTEQYAKARQVLRTAKKLDTTNEMTLRYIHELTKQQGKKSKPKSKGDSVEYSLGNETIIQPAHSRMREITSKIAVTNVLAGVLIGAAVVWFLIIPAVEESKSNTTNKQIVEYSTRIHALEAQVSAQTKTLDDYRAAELDKEAAQKNAASTADSYESLMTASEQYSSGSYSEDTVADTLLNVNPNVLGQGGQTLYTEISESVFPIACQSRYNRGVEALNVANYQGAIEAFQKVIKMDEQYEDGGALFNLGTSYMRNGENDNAKTYFNRVIELFPNSENAAAAQSSLNSMDEAKG
ncbi:MAG: tetratricopeptide repeat protein [Candidatus Ruminococcus intestinipullorum]|nr:tetratricopeptide repeat protein [Candidatus Ruminococcus intestinipullorum]